MGDNEKLPPLINALLKTSCFDHPAEQRELIETHISWVILAGDYAYKIKKPVDLGFLDFSTLEKRRVCCEEELRLNRRLAEEIYLSVIAIGGSPESPLLGADANVIEYAVKMRRFPQEAQLDRVLQRGELDAYKIDAFARMAAEFHATATSAESASEFGTPEQVWHPIAENFAQIREHLSGGEWEDQLANLEQWSRERYQVLLPLLQQRKQQGFIRECHGDLHLRNLAWIDGRAMAFDCIEFNPSLRWIDVISDIAFLVMDLRERGEPQLAQRFLNNYLEISGDYTGLPLLPFYMLYRAMVRTKVAAIRAGQKNIPKTERGVAVEEFTAYLEFAKHCIEKKQQLMLVTRGLSASGKSKHSSMLLEWMGAIRIRSDVERKRLYGLSADESGKAAPGEGIYSTEAGKKTYERLAELAVVVLDSGYPVIIDAVCGKREQRDRFYRLAENLEIPILIIEFQAPAEELRKRIGRRKGGVSDADLSVLEHQLEHWQSLQKDEEKYLLLVDTAGPLPQSGKQLSEKIYHQLGLTTQ